MMPVLTIILSMCHKISVLFIFFAQQGSYYEWRLVFFFFFVARSMKYLLVLSNT